MLICFANLLTYLELDNMSVGTISLSLSNRTEPIVGLEDVNRWLITIGAHVHQIEIPHEMIQLLDSSHSRALNEEECSKLIQQFTLDRVEWLAMIRRCGRDPVLPEGGYLSTSEVGVPPYPKVYDMMAMSHDQHIAAEQKFGRLHVNKSADTGVDELMALVAGGPWTWFFGFPDKSVGKLSMSRINFLDQAISLGWGVAYTGANPHGAFMNAKDGLVVASICGPELWSMCYEAPEHPLNDLLGNNPWVDFSSDVPRLL